MALWINIYSISMILFMAAYILNNSLIAALPTLLIVGGVFLTFLRILHHSRMIIAKPIAVLFLASMASLTLFIIKHVAISDGGGATLAIKIALYHLVFMAALLIGYYDFQKLVHHRIIYLSILFIAPVLFFLFIAKDRPPSEALYVFNRNPFAAYCISISALLLGFGTGRPFFSVYTYALVIGFVLTLNSTLGALLAFAAAFLVFIGPRALLNKKVFLPVVALSGVGAGFVFYVVANPTVLADVETVERLRFMGGIFSNLFRFYTGSWLELDMATAVRFAPSGELDMSGVFRVLHWINIIAVSVENGSGTIWIGGGTNWIEANQHRFVFTLAAHNEYVRLAVEQGLLHTAFISVGLWVLVFRLRNRPLFVPLLAFTIFLASENMLNDFVSTTVFFFILGHSVAFDRRVREMNIPNDRAIPSSIREDPEASS